MIGKNHGVFEKLTVNEVCNQLFDARCQFTSGDPFMHGKILTASCLIRGQNLSTYETESAILRNLKKRKTSFVEWIPDNVMNTICKVPAANLASEVSGTFLTNSSVQNKGMESLVGSFEAMFNKKAYVHWYTAEGMDQMEFREALSNV